MGVSENRVFSLQTIQFHKVFHSKPSILGYPHFWKHPYLEPKKSSQQWRSDWSGTLQKPKLQCTEWSCCYMFHILREWVSYFDVWWRNEILDWEIGMVKSVMNWKFTLWQRVKKPEIIGGKVGGKSCQFFFSRSVNHMFWKISSWHRNSSTGWCFPIHLGVGALHQPVSNTPKIYTSQCRIPWSTTIFGKLAHGFPPFAILVQSSIETSSTCRKATMCSVHFGESKWWVFLAHVASDGVEFWCIDLTLKANAQRKFRVPGYRVENFNDSWNNLNPLKDDPCFCHGLKSCSFLPWCLPIHPVAMLIWATSIFFTSHPPQPDML